MAGAEWTRATRRPDAHAGFVVGVGDNRRRERTRREQASLNCGLSANPMSSQKGGQATGKLCAHASVIKTKAAQR